MEHKIYDSILDYVGNTPMIKIGKEEFSQINIYAMAEGYNPSGSIKDRAASVIIQGLLERGEINKDTTIVESSSGNFGIALAGYCKKHSLRFICVVDPKIQSVNELILKEMGVEIVKVTKEDGAGGYLKTRIEKVKELVASIPNSYWINQYENIENAMAYHTTIGEQICSTVKVDYIFLGVSSGGTIAGISNCVKKHYPDAKVIAVDIEGSVVLGGEPKNRHISGIGSSIVPKILSTAKIDERIIVTEKESIEMCRKILRDELLFVGGSSGCVYAAVRKYFEGKEYTKKPNVVMVFADRGDRYCDTVYNSKWVQQLAD